jgi:hypothetical protein
VVVGGQTVQVATADQVNEMDLAADNSPRITQPTTQPTIQPTESTEPPSDRSDLAAAADAMAKAMPASQAVSTPAPAAASQTASDQNASTVGSASWIAQALAALGGAIAAGTVAWFLIGAGPVRTYG